MVSESFENIKALCLNKKNPELQELVTVLTANPNAAHEADDSGRTLLSHAAYRRDLYFCKHVLSANPDAVHRADSKGFFPFNWSCRGRNFAVAGMLIDLNPTATNIQDPILRQTPIHHVLFSSGIDIYDIINLLLKFDQGAIFKPDVCGWHPLHYVARFHDDPRLAKLVFDAHPEAMYRRCQRLKTPSDWANESHHNRVANFLRSQDTLRLQALTHYQDGHATTPVHYVFQHEDVSVGAIKLLLKDNPDYLEAPDSNGHYIVHLALALQGEGFHYDRTKLSVDIVALLIRDHPNSLANPDSDGNYAIHLACQKGNFDLINMLLDKSECNLSTRNSDGKLPIQLLVDCGKARLMDYQYASAFYRLFRKHPAVHDIFANEC